MNQIKEDEIDFLALTLTLWDGKLLIIAFSALAVLFGSVFLLVKDPVYHSKIIYSANTIPPFYQNNKGNETYKLNADFKEMFESIITFKDWKKVSGNTSIGFSDFSSKKVVDSFTLFNEEANRMATFDYINGEAFILIKSNKLDVVNSFFQYAQHINKMLKLKYILEAETMVSNEKNSKTHVSNRSSLELFLYQITKSNIFNIEHPTQPSLISPKKFEVLIISILFGTITGVISVLIRIAIRNRKKISANS